MAGEFRAGFVAADGFHIPDIEAIRSRGAM